MNFGFSAFSRGSAARDAGASVWLVRLRNLFWLVGATVVALVLLRAADGAPQDLRNPAIVAKLLAIERADPWSAEEQRLQAVIADIRRRHEQFRRHQPLYSQAVVDQTREQMMRYITQGIAPSVALSRAVQEAERGGLLPVAIAE